MRWIRNSYGRASAAYQIVLDKFKKLQYKMTMQKNAASACPQLHIHITSNNVGPRMSAGFSLGIIGPLQHPYFLLVCYYTEEDLHMVAEETHRMVMMPGR